MFFFQNQNEICISYSFAMVLITTFTDDSDKPCLRPAIQEEDGVIVLHDRSTELILMDNETSTCLPAHTQGGRFRHAVVYFYVPTPEDALRFILEISEMECTYSSLVVYHLYGNGDMYIQCILVGSDGTQEIQKCEFMCSNICPQESVATIYVKTQRVLKMPHGSPSICGISLPN